MDVRHLGRGEWLTAVTAVGLIVSLFLPWYGAGGATATAWQTMALNDVIMALAALGGLTAVALAATRPVAGLTVATASLAALVATLAALLALIRVLSPAPDGDVSLEAGAWLGLVSALGLAVGSWWSARSEGPARRNPAAERAATQEGLARSELLPLPPDVGPAGSGGSRA